MDQILWVEMYRPKNIDECILPKSIKKTFKEFVKNKELPNLLLSGGSGVGKTTVARALCEELNTDCMIINGSEESGIDILRTKIKQFASTHGDYQSSYYCLSILLNDALSLKRLDIINFLKEKGIGTSVYYPRPVPLFTYYKNKYGYKEEDFPVASWISKSSIAFPVGPHLNTEDIKYIIQELKSAI